jgi:hypothetical protein
MASAQPAPAEDVADRPLQIAGYRQLAAIDRP